MPELPEVETVRRELEPHITGNTIISAKVLSPSLRSPLPQDMSELLTDNNIVSITRRAKYLLFMIDCGLTMVVHLGMTGRLSIDNNKGYFQHNFAVYGKAGSDCRRCGGTISKTYQGGRATFFCAGCQV